MAARSIEARLVISGEDKGASASIASVVKSVRQLEEVSKVSAPLQRMAKDFQQVEQASKAVNAAMSARTGFTAAEAGLKATQGAAQAAAKALEQAKVARAAFDGVKAAKGSDQAKQIEAATKAVQNYTAAQNKADGDVRRATAAIAAQSSALQHAEASAARFGADLGDLEAHQQRLRSTTESATEAMRHQIRVEDQAARSVAHHAKEEAEFARHRKMHGLVGAGAAVASGAVGIHGVGHIIAHGAQAGAEVQSERVRLEAINVPAAERQHIETRSLDLAAKYKNVTQASVMELWKEMRSVMTDPHEVDHVIDPMVRAKSILDAQDKTGTASHGLNLLVKGAESIGAAKDPERFNKLLDGYIKAMQVMGKTITPEGIYEMQKYSKAAGARWSDRFIMTTAQSLGQEMGGSTAGNSIQMAQKQIVGGMQNLHFKAKEFARIGLIDEKNLDYLKTGEVKGVKAGVRHAVKGDDLAATDLDQWVYKVLLPALEKHGVKAEGDQLAWVQKNFTGTAGDVVSKLITQRESFEAHERMYGTSSGLAGQAHNRDDATAALGSVTTSLETFLGVLTSPGMRDAAHILDSVAGGIGAFSVRLEAFNKEHPTIAKAEGPVAAGVAVAGAGLASAAVYQALSSGFGLKTSAAALDHSAILLDAAAVRLSGGTVPESVKSVASTAVPALAGFGLAGITLGTSAAAAFSAYATAQEMPKVLAEKGPAAIDPATGGATEANPMEGLAPDTPWIRDWWTKTMPTWAGGSEEAGKKVGETMGKAIVDAPLPPRRPAMLEDFQTKAGETGAEAGKTLLQRIIEAVGTGINVPINFVPGDGSGGGGGSGIQNASFGGGGLGGLIQRASLGGGGVGSGIGTGGGGGGGLSHGGGGGSLQSIPASIQATEAERNKLGLIQKYESGGRNVPNYINDRRHTAQGYYQITNTNWRNIAPKLGITAPNAMSASHADQARVALYLLRGTGIGNWTPKVAQALRRGERAQFGAESGPVAKRAPAGEPHLIKGLDGKEGLDLGNGTMKMPDGSIRSITRTGLEIPDAPSGGLGGGTGSRADLQAAADRMHAAAEKFENAGFHGQIEVTGLRRSGLRATAIKMRGRGGLTADMGVSEPGAKEDLGDWA